MKSLASYAFLIAFLFATSAYAQTATIQGDAGDTNGRPLKNAEVRVQAESSKSAPVTVKTNTKGHFVASNLRAGNYTVTVVVDGAVKWSAANVKAVKGQAVYLKLSGKQAAVATVAASNQPKKRSVWVKDSVGSHLGGHWEDEPYQGPQQDSNTDTVGSEQLRQLQNTRQLPSGAGGR